MSRVAAAFERAGLSLSGTRQRLDRLDQADGTLTTGAPPNEPDPWNLVVRETAPASSGSLEDPWSLDGVGPAASEPESGTLPPSGAAPEDLSALSAPPNVSSPISVGAVLDPPYAGPDVGPVAREQYRKLGATLHDSQREHRLGVVMITSALPNEGKTFTATNLARTLSSSYCRNVLLIDADYRRPRLHEVFGIPETMRPKDALARPAMSCVVRVRPGLWVLPAAPIDGDPLKAMISDRMRQAIADGKSTFDWVIVDTPPVGLLADASVVASMADAVLLVVAANKTPHTQIRRAADALRSQRFLAVVLNQVDTAQLDPGGAYYSSYSGAPTAS